MVDMRRSAWSFKRSYLSDSDTDYGPYIASIDPSSGGTAGGTTVTVTLGNIGALGATAIFFGSEWGEDLSFLDAGIYSVLTPPSVTGTGPVDVTVNLDDLSTATLTDGFTYT